VKRSYQCTLNGRSGEFKSPSLPNVASVLLFGVSTNLVNVNVVIKKVSPLVVSKVVACQFCVFNVLSVIKNIVTRMCAFDFIICTEIYDSSQNLEVRSGDQCLLDYLVFEVNK